MAINFGNGLVMQNIGTKMNLSGHVVQVINTTTTSSLSTTSTSPVNFFTSSSITLSAANNYVLVEWHSDNREDWSDNQWNLYYMDLVYVNTSTQLSYTGYRGAYTSSINGYQKSYLHQPGNVGPHSYLLRGWAYSASVNARFNLSGDVGNDGIAYIRMTEIAV